jgi:anti-sigma-K factor RskA
VLVAAPNLLTLGIVIGRGGAAHAAERTLDVDAPGFRNSSLAGAILAVLALAAAWYLLFSRQRAKERLARLRARK